MKINNVPIEQTYAEAFTMKVARLVITAPNRRWCRIAAASMTGFATSVIACGCEAGVEVELPPAATPDRRPGVAVLIFAMSGKELAKQLVNRVGQCILTCPGTACYDGFADDPEQRNVDACPLGRTLRYFGDGFQAAKRIGSMRVWRIPVMDGEFVCSDQVNIRKGIGGGNILLPARSAADALVAAEAASAKIAKLEGVITPFPGGIVRSGSKVGSRYPGLIASTNDAWSPTIRSRTDSALPAGSNSVLEIVVDGVDQACVEQALLLAMLAACERAGKALTAVSAGNYGGSLGSHHFHLHRILGAGGKS